MAERETIGGAIQRKPRKERGDIGLILIIGIILSPQLFGWFLFRSGTPIWARVLGLPWLAINLVAVLLVLLNKFDPTFLRSSRTAMGLPALAEKQTSHLGASALAVGMGNRGGFALGEGSHFPTRSAAEAAALEQCRAAKNTPRVIARCKIVAHFDQRCLAVAWEDPGLGFGWAIDSDVSAAHNGALEKCRQTAKIDPDRARCVVRMSKCDR